jgi:4-amino-4-deoxy-L-arabinose transferase-like glycosyltransferase
MCATISPVQRRAAISVVFLIALVTLGWNAGSPGIATAYVDPVARIPAQDESLYGSISLEMAKTGDWITPRFLDRYALVKPPLLYWLEGAAIKTLGPKPISLRLPSILAGAATVTLVFAWLLEDALLADSASLAAAAAGAILLLSSHLFFVLSRIGLTDALLTFETALAMFALTRDPRLASRASLWTFGIASGAAILTKGIAGLFSLLALFVLCVISRERPAWRRLAAAVAISAAVALPWHLYQLFRNTRWFWAEYVVTEVVGNSVGKPDQTTQESQVGYYLKRLIALDAPLFAAALVALARRRPRVLLAWIAVVLAAALSFEYRNTSYLLPVFPAMAVLAAGAIPQDRAKWALALAVALLAAKALAPAQTWGIPFQAESVIAVEPVLDRYAAMSRGNELILGEPNDGFYSACLDLARVRYLYLDPSTERRRYALDFEYLGILMTAADFARLPAVKPQFEQRLRDWGLYRGDPVATTILAPTLEQIQALVHDHPQADFLLPADWAAQDAGVHEIVQTGADRELLLSREVVHRP